MRFIWITLLKLFCPFEACKKRIHPRAGLYHRLVQKSETTLNKELDLEKFMIRQRIQTNALIGLLNNQQSKFLDRMSQLVIRESTDNHETTSADSELSDCERDNMDYARRMAYSGD